jgi:hypothetical protein
MKQRDPLTALLLGLFVPFYPLYWFYIVTKEVEASHNVNLPSVWLLFAPTLIALILWPLFFIINIVLSTASNDTGQFMFVNFILLAPLVLIANFTLTAIYMYRFCRAIGAVVDTGLTPGIMCVLAIFFSPIVIYMVQEKLSLLEQPTNPPSLPPASPVS